MQGNGQGSCRLKFANDKRASFLMSKVLGSIVIRLHCRTERYIPDHTIVAMSYEVIFSLWENLVSLGPLAFLPLC